MAKRPVLEKIERTQIVYRGLSQAARLLGCSRPHLSYVLHGQRKPSEKLARGLRRMGITCTVDGEELRVMS
ncbi:MAG: helix-turn-helix transcriptional regulator [Kiritimatiellae bacterium]|nr:helix-turn-helix transcriptional regulator [Kiritimatiellia bacterium]